MISTQEEWRQPGAGAWLGKSEKGFFCHKQRPSIEQGIASWLDEASTVKN